MGNVIVLALPRSCSTFFMKQFVDSKLHVVENTHHEIIPTQNRRWTRKYLGLPEIKDWKTWDYDTEYVQQYIKNHPEGVAMKVIVHAHKHCYINTLKHIPDTTFIKLWREDEASAIASMLSRRLAQYYATNNKEFGHAYVRSSRSDLYRYADIKHLKYSTTDDPVRRMLEGTYWHCIHKTKSLMDMIPTPYTFTEKDFHPEWCNSELETKFEFKFNYDTFLPPSHYSEVFEDWQVFEKDVRTVLGPIPGIA
jgi:hypothetical protein